MVPYMCQQVGRYWFSLWHQTAIFRFIKLIMVLFESGRCVANSISLGMVCESITLYVVANIERCALKLPSTAPMMSIFQTAPLFVDQPVNLSLQLSFKWDGCPAKLYQVVTDFNAYRYQTFFIHRHISQPLSLE